ncbi:hypothetical protein Bcav_3679 [Beutenbergia cavernae DSM 12333]|uniref:Uncharacterized protein n=1 Tax=Beutenbergia cavernae (strain ATCC BAA-8 / DSM 12333 / CCUG 43141 / JCM 11478 / NBRC 16432 / NCIMB 13614 / HKI 0122) TaxID=471853 RepID=C5C3L2_BEUC1|nr:hypothetical protein [Beutenbergia cavernae]ACQ81921.1 hypothetical protein Bcav_3679 [Beutenbergia cavernae DSM 12333]
MTTSHDLPTLARRTVLAGGLAAGAAALAAAPARATPPAVAVPRQAPATSGPLPLVAPLAAEPDRTAFEPQEQRYAAYLVTLAAMANDIDDSDTELRGYQAGGWWRTPSEPFNARISEHVATFAWFLTADRGWNPYRGDAALAGRLDAAIDYYLRLQHDDGSWQEFSAEERSRAATAFALGYLSKTLALLRDADLLPERRDAISSALHRAMTWFLDPANDGVWTGEIVEFANQPAAGLAGSAKALALDPDPALSRLLWDRVRHYAERAQSPAGFLYEPRGMDIAYNLNVTLTEFHELHTELKVPVLLPVVRRLADWLTYTVVPEPDGAGLVSFASGAARTPMYVLDAVTLDRQQRDLGSVFSRLVPDLGAFYPAREDRDAQRAAWAASSDPIEPLAPGDTNPRIPANIPFGEGFPSRRRRDVALRTLPAVRRERFTELRTDPLDQHYLFVRRPAHYVQAFFGTRPNGVVRAGLGLLWHPRAGTFVHGGQNSNTECWATVLPNGGTDGASNLAATYYDGPVSDGRVVAPDDAARVRGDLGVAWTTTGGNVAGSVLLHDAGLVREITTAAGGVEQVPLVLRADDVVTWASGDGAAVGAPSSAHTSGIAVRRGDVTLTIDWEVDADATLTPTERTYFADASRRAHMLRVPLGAAARIAYAFA